MRRIHRTHIESIAKKTFVVTSVTTFEIRQPNLNSEDRWHFQEVVAPQVSLVPRRKA